MFRSIQAVIGGLTKSEIDECEKLDMFTFNKRHLI